MAWRASAPGKVVLLGEYAVLDGAPALVTAVARRVRARLEPLAGPECELTTRTSATEVVRFPAGRPSGIGLVDTVMTAAAGPRRPAWRGTLDSSELFHGMQKLGLGSSAAALAAWAGVWWAAAEPAAAWPAVDRLIELHRQWQGGSGSGLDVAAARVGGVIEYRLDPQRKPEIGSVRLPNSVGFAGIFAGSSASTADFVGRYREWTQAAPGRALELRKELTELARNGCAAARRGDGTGLVRALAAYGECLGRLGGAMGADLVTREHGEIGRLAGRFGVAYKVSGAGGGDLGIAASEDATRLGSFTRAVQAAGFHVVGLEVDEQGLVVEEQP
jgi:phosphomevalonate kinase